MAFMELVGWFGIRWFVWIYFTIGNVVVGVSAIWWYREKIRKTYYDIRYEEKVIKVVIHHATGMYKNYWRLIPENNAFGIQGKVYAYDDNNVIKDNDFFGVEEKGKTKIKAGGKTYDFNEKLGIKDKDKKYIEIHYWYNNPNPIKFEDKSRALKVTSTDLATMEENDLFKKLLTLEGEKGLLVIVLIMTFIIAGGVLFIVAKMMGWIQ